MRLVAYLWDNYESFRKLHDAHPSVVYMAGGRGGGAVPDASLRLDAPLPGVPLHRSDVRNDRQQQRSVNCECMAFCCVVVAVGAGQRCTQSRRVSKWRIRIDLFFPERNKKKKWDWVWTESYLSTFLPTENAKVNIVWTSTYVGLVCDCFLICRVLSPTGELPKAQRWLAVDPEEDICSKGRQGHVAISLRFAFDHDRVRSVCYSLLQDDTASYWWKRSSWILK